MLAEIHLVIYFNKKETNVISVYCILHNFRRFFYRPQITSVSDDLNKDDHKILMNDNNKRHAQELLYT